MDTQWDEFLQSGEGVVTGVEIISNTLQLETTGVEPEAVSIFEEENNTSKDYQMVNINNGLKGETVNKILVSWDAYYEVEGYKVYKRINDEGFNMVYDWPDPPTSSGYGLYDSDFSVGNTYSYYITAYGPDWETSPSEIASIEITAYTFLPACSLISPTDGLTIVETNPVFSWSPVGLDALNLPYGDVYSGRTYLRIYDADTYETAWSIWFDDMTTSTATYDQNGNADPLIPGNTYRWYIRTYGYDNNGNYVSSSYSETWEFDYDGESVVTDVWAYTITAEPGVTPPDASIDMGGFKSKKVQLSEGSKLFSIPNFNRYREEKGGEKIYFVQLEWNGYPNATGYNIHRSVNGEGYSIVINEVMPEYLWCSTYDYDVSPENTYSYYITAYGSDWETAPSQTVTRDTWLPPCSLISPVDDSSVTNPNQIFAWNPVGLSTSNFPYGSIYSGDSILWVYDHIDTQDTWERILYDNMTTSTISYDDDGQAIPLISGHDYVWNYFSYGYDEYDNLIAGSLAEGWDMFAGWDITYE
jgi:hypothetical protein